MKKQLITLTTLSFLVFPLSINATSAKYGENLSSSDELYSLSDDGTLNESHGKREGDTTKSKADQNVNAKVISGGLTGGIGSSDFGKGLQTVDVDFGRIQIAKPIQSATVENMVAVRDWTGGDGWDLTVKHKDVDRDDSLQLSLQVDNGEKINLSDDAQLVVSGKSAYAPTIISGQYFADWGTNPTVGEFNNVLEWVLVPYINIS